VDSVLSRINLSVLQLWPCHWCSAPPRFSARGVLSCKRKVAPGGSLQGRAPLPGQRQNPCCHPAAGRGGALPVQETVQPKVNSGRKLEELQGHARIPAARCRDHTSLYQRGLALLGPTPAKVCICPPYFSSRLTGAVMICGEPSSLAEESVVRVGDEPGVDKSSSGRSVSRFELARAAAIVAARQSATGHTTSLLQASAIASAV